jgi:cytochrome c biogenesis protein CcdA
MGSEVLGLALGASVLGLSHGIAPGHGWAIAASYALDKPNKWLYGAVSSLILGIGHLISSIAVVVLYFWALSYFGLTQLSWMNYVAGVLLIGLGIWQYFNGHDHGTGSEHEGEEEDLEHAHDHAVGHQHSHSSEEIPRWGARFRSALPFVDESNYDHSPDHVDEAPDRGLYGMVGLAFVLGFTHNEEFDIIAICTGSQYCLELMFLYSLAVIVSLVGITLLLVAGYERYEERLEGYAEYLSPFTAAILIVMGVGFILGVF